MTGPPTAFAFIRLSKHDEMLDKQPNSDEVILHKHWRRPPPPSEDPEWDKFVCIGTTLIQMMESDDRGAGHLFKEKLEKAQSKFEDFPCNNHCFAISLLLLLILPHTAEFTKWGYHSFTEDKFNEYEKGISAVFKDLGISTEQKDHPKGWKTSWVYHNPSHPLNPDSQKYYVDGKEYRATNARYQTQINVEDGVIMFSERYSPAHMGAKRLPPVTKLPELRRASDINWGQWVGLAGNKASNIRYMIAWCIINETSGRGIRRALKTQREDMLPVGWPGSTFGTETPEGKALLGGVSRFIDVNVRC